MSIDNIKLPGGLIIQLYKDSLVETAGAKQSNSKIIENKYNTLGNNQKNILLIVNDSTSLHLNDNDFQFLTGILNACKLNMADICLLNIVQYTNKGFDEISQFFSPNHVILFDVKEELTALKISSAAYEILKYKDIQIITAPSLRFISENTEEKKKLWGALKKIFNL